MPLNDKQREVLEDTIMDLHYTSQKYIETQKDLHKKLLEVNVEEAIEMLKDISDDITDDEKRHDYKMHMLLPLQIYELMVMRKEKQEEEE